MARKVLCIDDDPITLMLCRKVIERVAFAENVATAQNGEEALHFFQNLTTSSDHIPPDMVFLDLNMPIMNGWEFLDEYIACAFHIRFPHTKFVVLSSTIDPSDIHKSKSYTIVVDFISKPITKEILEGLKDTL